MANLQLKCPCCGGALEFNDKTQTTVCPYCDSQFTANDLKAYTDELASQGQEDTSWDESMVQAYTNEEKKGIKGYIGASAIAELTYVVILNLIHNKNIEIYILNMPSEEVSSYDEVKFWLDMGWIKLYKED